MDLEFKSIKELYDSIEPALRTKKYELKKLGYLVSEADIWNYLKINKWCKDVNLSISEMVDDIMMVDIYKVDRFLKDHLKKNDRNML